MRIKTGAAITRACVAAGCAGTFSRTVGATTMSLNLLKLESESIFVAVGLPAWQKATSRVAHFGRRQSFR